LPKTLEMKHLFKFRIWHKGKGSLELFLKLILGLLEESSFSPKQLS
jgi:hypothetical protein